MILTLYQNSDDERVVNKRLQQIAQLSAAPITPVNIIAPSFILSTGNTLNANYLYCDTFARYYYIKDWQIDKGGRVVISCSIDVLTTYAAQILATKCLIVRQENIGSTYITDNKLPLYPYKETKVVEFTGGDFNLESATSNSFNFLLNVAGGGASAN